MPYNTKMKNSNDIKNTTNVGAVICSASHQWDSSAHEDSFYEDEAEDDRDLYDEDYYEEQREREIEEKLSDCHCGAYQLSKKGEMILVADCCC